MSFNIEQIQDYLKDLCHLHTDINHDVDGIKSFARFHSDEEMTALRNNAGPNVVVVTGIQVRRFGEKDDKMLQHVVVLRVVSYAQSSSDEEIRGAIKKAEGILLDLVIEMEKKQEDDADNDVCGIMQYLQPELISWEPVEDQPWLINHYGWDIEFPFKLFMPKRNPDKWRDI